MVTYVLQQINKLLIICTYKITFNYTPQAASQLPYEPKIFVNIYPAPNEELNILYE